MAINYKRTNWVDEVTPLDADNMNNIEEAIESLSSKAVSNISDGGGKGSVAQIGNVASGEGSAAFGVGSAATGMGSHAEGIDTLASAKGSHAEGWQSVASGQYSHAEGESNATAWQSHAENVSTASGEQSHSEGAATASGKLSHAEGGGKAYGERSHAEGSGRTGQATGEAGAWEAHAEGAGVALGVQSHAEGNGTVASGEQSHAEGKGNTASGKASHAQGIGNTASGEASHAQGIGNEALAEGEFVTGKYSNPEKNAVEDTVSGFLMRVGSGTSNTARSNCFTIDADETVSMKKAVISTDLISRPFSVINKDYADAHYVQVSSYTQESLDGYTQIIPKGSTIFESTSSASGSIGFYAKIGMYNLSIYEATQHPATDLVSKYVSYFFQPQYKQSRPLMYDVWVFPIYFYNTSLAVYCDADGTENENGQFIKVTCRMYYAKRS